MKKRFAALGLLHQPGIGRRLVLWILIFSSVVTLLSTALQLGYEFRRDVSDIQNRLLQIRDSNALSLAHSLWVTNQSAVQIQLDGIHSLPDMQYLEVRADQNQIVATAGKRQDTHNLRQETPLYFEYKGKPVRVGTLIAVASTEGAYQRLKDKVLVILFYQTIKTFLVSLFILFLFQLLVGRHLNTIAQHAESLEAGVADQPLVLGRAAPAANKLDELDHLVNAFNKMSRRLAAINQGLQENEESTRLMVEAVQDYAILRLDPLGQVITWNAGAQRIMGYRAGEIIGQPHSVFYAQEDVASGKPEQLLKTAQTAGRCEDEGWRMRKDGSQFWARVSITSLKDSLGQLTGYSKVTRDITSHKLAQDQLITYRNHLEDLVEARTAALLAAQHDLTQFKMTLDQTLDCVFMFDPDTLLCLYVNRGAIEQSGYEQAELSQLTPAELTPEYDTARLRKTVLQPLLDGKESVSRLETYLRSKQGHDLPVEVSIQLVTLDNTAQRIVAIVRDITERKKNEALMRERTLQLEATNTELEAFSYSVSHDLRAPLRAIDGFSQLLLEDCDDQLNDDGREYLDRVRNAAQYMGQLIDDMLELARVTRAPMQTHDINLTVMANEILNRLRDAEPTRTVQTDIADGLRCLGDPRLLRVALENLLGNAWKYTGKTAAAHIAFDTEQQGEQTVFCIRDNGAGFDMKFSGRMFSAFQRMHHKEEFEGAGIGLATVSRIVQRHGGRVWAEAKPDQGATFYFTLG